MFVFADENNKCWNQKTFLLFFKKHNIALTLLINGLGHLKNFELCRWIRISPQFVSSLSTSLFG